jgi:hypothetical protein
MGVGRGNNPKTYRPDHAQVMWQEYAARTVQKAKVHGLLPALDGTIACVDCGGRAHHYDHRDYSRPLDVVPVCPSCNRKRGTARWPKPEDFQFAPYVPRTA